MKSILLGKGPLVCFFFDNPEHGVKGFSLTCIVAFRLRLHSICIGTLSRKNSYYCYNYETFDLANPGFYV